MFIQQGWAAGLEIVFNGVVLAIVLTVVAVTTQVQAHLLLNLLDLLISDLT
jgi:hypothetical protein